MKSISMPFLRSMGVSSAMQSSTVGLKVFAAGGEKDAIPCFLTEIFCLMLHYHIAAQCGSIMWLFTIKGEAWFEGLLNLKLR